MTTLSTDLSTIAFPLKRSRPLAEAAAEGGPRFARALRRGESAYGRKISVCALAAAMGLISFTNAPAGQIGVTEDRTRWQEVAGLPADEQCSNIPVPKHKSIMHAGIRAGGT